jgi:Asp-tRNA(Asn)/Glu-tRNA(Gln) amidotransferase B subunit
MSFKDTPFSDTILPNTILVDTLDRLKNHLTTIYQASKTRETESEATKAKTEHSEYTRGIKDALELISLHIKQSQNTESPTPLQPKKKEPKHQKLYEMHAQDIVTLTRNSQKSEIFKALPKDDLIETAFKFENELMQLLGDENTIPFDTYTDLSMDQLVKIIKNCTEKITQIIS